MMHSQVLDLERILFASNCGNPLQAAPFQGCAALAMRLPTKLSTQVVDGEGMWIQCEGAAHFTLPRRRSRP
jgi:hypothetical protein